MTYELTQALVKEKKTYRLEIKKFVSDRLRQKLAEFNEKGNLQALKKSKAFVPIAVSEEGLELIELVALDCKNSTGAWHSSVEIKIDKHGFVTKNGKKAKTFGTLRLQLVKNLCG